MYVVTLSNVPGLLYVRFTEQLYGQVEHGCMQPSNAYLRVRILVVVVFHF